MWAGLVNGKNDIKKLNLEHISSIRLISNQQPVNEAANKKKKSLSDVLEVKIDSLPAEKFLFLVPWKQDRDKKFDMLSCRRGQIQPLHLVRTGDMSFLECPLRPNDDI